MSLNIGVFGTGQLGSRYIQGLVSSDISLNIYAYDLSETSLDTSRRRFNEVDIKTANHSIFFSSDLINVPKDLDLAIISTTASARIELATQLQSICKIQNWLFEKVLAQSISNLDQLDKLINTNQRAWVNTPMYLWSLYKNLRMEDISFGPINASFTGFKGLACNAIHYIDLVSRWNDSRIVKIDTSRLSKRWYESKRPGFYEVDGELLISFSDLSTLTLRTNEFERSQGYKASIETSDNKIWSIDESAGLAISNHSKILNGEVPLQSSMTAPLTRSIIFNQKCDLPSLSESINQHKPLLDALLKSWNLSNNTLSSILPIT